MLRELLQRPELDLFGEITVDDNCMIGAEAMIMPNVHIGHNCIIAARAVVTKDVPDNTIVGGVPARVIETVDEYCKKGMQRAVNTKQLSRKEKQKFLQEHYHSDMCR